MEYILIMLKDYDVELDYKHSIFTIRKPISVPFFIYVKNLIHQNTDFKEIRVETIRSKYEYRY